MKGVYLKAAAVVPEILIAGMFALLVFAVWGLGAQAAQPEFVELPAENPAPLIAEDLPAHALSASAEDGAAVVHLPQISEVLDAAPQIPAIKIELPPPLVEQPSPEDANRVEHARELLGKFYNRSVVKSGEKIAQVGQFIRERTRKALRPEFKKYAKEIADAVIRESGRHGFDPVFLMAVIENESSFDPHVVGSVGEIGLMQLTPATAAWVAKKFNIKWHGKKSLREPRVNIRLGAAYLSYLRDRFDSHSRLYLAAYNMGSHNVSRALGHSVWPKDYPQRVMKRYIRYYGDLKSELKSEPKHKT